MPPTAHTAAKTIQRLVALCFATVINGAPDHHHTPCVKLSM
jgi:hypothetical protein